METPIISPWLIYLINFMPNLTYILFIIGSIFLVIGGYALWVCYDQEYLSDIERFERYKHEDIVTEYELKKLDYCKKEYNKQKKRIIICSIFTILFYILAILVPSASTCYQMLIAHYVTYENVDYAGEQIKDITDYVFDKIEEVNN